MISAILSPPDPVIAEPFVPSPTTTPCSPGGNRQTADAHPNSGRVL